MSFEIDMQIEGLDRAQRRVAALGGWSPFELMDTVGQTIVGHTQDRIRNTKTGPDGKVWPKTYSGREALYVAGHLDASIQARPSQSAVQVGSALRKAALLHFGGVVKAKNGKALKFAGGGGTVFRKSVKIPPRPYLGISADNREDIVSVVEDFLLSIMDEAAS